MPERNSPLCLSPTIKRRIRDMADDVEQQVVAEILGALLNTFSIQLDESMDVSSCAHVGRFKCFQILAPSKSQK